MMVVQYRHRANPETVQTVPRLTPAEAEAVQRLFTSPAYRRAGYIKVAIVQEEVTHAEPA